MTKYTADSKVDVKFSIQGIIDVYEVLLATYSIEPHNPLKAEAFFLFQNVIESMMQDKEIHKVIEEIYNQEIEYQKKETLLN